MQEYLTPPCTALWGSVKFTLLRKLLVTLPAWVFDSFTYSSSALSQITLLKICRLYCLQGYFTSSCTALLRFRRFVLSKMARRSSLIVTLPAAIFDSLFFFRKTYLCSYLVLPARLFNVFIYCPLVFSKMPLWSCSMVAFLACIFYSLMYSFCAFKIKLVSTIFCISIKCNIF